MEKSVEHQTKQYNLVHITTSGEYQAPLVASQLFDQAEAQATIRQGFAPHQVEAWTIGAFSEYFKKNARKKIAELRIRCPHVRINMINGVSRLKHFPKDQLLIWRRMHLGKHLPVIYHCRGESSVAPALFLKKYFPHDRIVVDIRGFWPAELLYKRGIEYPERAIGKDREDYEAAAALLRQVLGQVDGMTTVSTSLRELLVKDFGARQNSIVVPCCVTSNTDDSRRIEIREKLGIRPDEFAVVYSGTTAAYQHLEDLTMPFLKQLADKDPKVKLVFYSSEIDKINRIVTQLGIPKERIVTAKLQQNEVGAHLTACDAGVLIRKTTLVNTVANPVKIAEYMAAGLPVIIENGVGGIVSGAYPAALYNCINVSGEHADLLQAAHVVSKWLNEGNDERRQAVREYVSNVYLWKAAVQVSRGLYADILKQ